jgi:hypothetical protein
LGRELGADVEPDRRCLYGVIGSALAGITAAGAFGSGLLDQLDVLQDVSQTFQMWWVIGSGVLGLIGGLGLGAASASGRAEMVRGTAGYTAMEGRRTIQERRAIMRGQLLIRAAWVPLLAGGLLALYAPNFAVFAAAALVFVAAASLQTAAAVRVVRLARRRV